jgi:transitional endoplasmic reticulum ATPase
MDGIKLATGQVLDDKFTVKFLISESSTSQKYRVESVDGNTFALTLYDSKLLPPGSFVDGELYEALLVKAITAPYLCSYIDSGVLAIDRGRFNYIVSEFVSGESLREKLAREGALSSLEASDIVVKVCACLNDLHIRHNVIHNNIGLDSVMLDYSESGKTQIKLTCMQWARRLSDHLLLEDLERIHKAYVAPELKNGIFGEHSDVFQAGALLFHLIVGAAPSLSKTGGIAANAFVGSEGITLGGQPYLKVVIEKAMSSKVENRYLSVEEFKYAIESFGLDPKHALSESPLQDVTGIPLVKESGKKGFDAVAGMSELKEILRNDVIRALTETELYEEYGLSIPNGMMLYGPPGCGKTYIAERFSEEIGFTFMQFRPSDIKSKWVNDTELRIAAAFNEAKENAPTVMFIDEFDALVPDRESATHEMASAPVNEFLTHLSETSANKVFVIGATNRIEKIDPAVLRTGRIDRLIYVPPPDFSAREKLFSMYLNDRPVDLDLDCRMLATITTNYVASDIKFIVDEASRVALKAKQRIDQGLLTTMIAKKKPSLSEAQLEHYESLREQYTR